MYQPVDSSKLAKTEKLIRKDGRIYYGMSAKDFIDKFWASMTAAQIKTMKRLQAEGKTA